VQVIIVDQDGHVTEQQYPYDAATGGITIDETVGGPNASIFFPFFAAEYLWAAGHWVNEGGYYYENNHWVQINDPDWHDKWNGYWNNTWKDKWNNYWNQHHNEQGWQYRDNRQWQHRQYQPIERGGQQRDDRGGMDRGDRSGREGRGGSRR
jgi:hypothetical protein